MPTLFFLFVKRIRRFTKEYSANKVSFYKKRHRKAKTTNAENIFSNPILHEISPPLTWELLLIEANVIQTSKSLQLEIHLWRIRK